MIASSAVALFLLAVSSLIIESDGGEISRFCPDETPWACEDRHVCLSRASVCNGHRDCYNGDDEDRVLCTPKERPTRDALKNFIEDFYDWLVPNVLGEGTADQLAKHLTEARNVTDYAKKIGLTEEQKETLVDVMEYAQQSRYLDLIALKGMPVEAYRSTHKLFGRMVESRFLGYIPV